MKKGYNLLLLNDTTNWYHFGCTATSLALKENIIKLGYDLTSIPVTETYKLKKIPQTWEYFQSPLSFELFIKANPDIFTAIEKNDIIMLNGEGTLHGLRPAPLGLLYVAYATKVFMHKNVQIINHSVYPQDDLSLTDSKTRNLYYQVYKVLDFVAIREPLSFNLMKSLDIDCIESFDCMPIYIKDHYLAHSKRDGNTLLIAGSAAWLHLNMLSAKKGNIEEFEKGLSKFIAYINKMSERGFKVQFLYGAKEYPSKDDREFINFIEPRLTIPWEVITATSLDEWLSIIEKATLLVSGRFHHSLAAACLGTPFIALNSNTPKVNGLMKSMKYDKTLNYSDPELCEKLLAISETVQKEGPLTMLDTLLDTLYSKAMLNFSHLTPYKSPDLEITTWQDYVSSEKSSRKSITFSP